MSTVGSPGARKPLAKPSIYSRLSASPSAARPTLGSSVARAKAGTPLTSQSPNATTTAAARNASVKGGSPQPHLHAHRRGLSSTDSVAPPHSGTSVTSNFAASAGHGPHSPTSHHSAATEEGGGSANLGFSILGSSAGSPKAPASMHEQHSPFSGGSPASPGGISSTAANSTQLEGSSHAMLQQQQSGASTATHFAQRGSINASGSSGISAFTQSSKAPSVAGTAAVPSSVVESSIAFDTENHIKNFNDELVRDNELMLQEIEELRDENDIMFDELHRLRTENALLKEQNLELTDSVNGQNEAFVRLSSEVAREMTITESLRKTFDTLHANRFDNLFTKMSRAKHASLGRPPTTRENLQIAREALDESNKQINNIFEIVHSMSQVPNFMSNPKDVLVVDATMQVVSLCKVINSMIVADKMRHDKKKGSSSSSGADIAGVAAAMTPRTGTAGGGAPSTAPLPSARGSGGGGISGFFKRMASTKSPNGPASAQERAAEEDFETLVTVLTARQGTARGGSNGGTSGALQLPNENIHMPVSAKEVDKRATLLQRIASVFGSNAANGGGNNSANTSAAVSRTNSSTAVARSYSSASAGAGGGGQQRSSTARGVPIPVASSYFSTRTLPNKRTNTPPPVPAAAKQQHQDPFSRSETTATGSAAAAPNNSNDNPTAATAEGAEPSPATYDRRTRRPDSLRNNVEMAAGDSAPMLEAPPAPQLSTSKRASRNAAVTPPLGASMAPAAVGDGFAVDAEDEATISSSPQPQSAPEEGLRFSSLNATPPLSNRGGFLTTDAAV